MKLETFANSPASSSCTKILLLLTFKEMYDSNSMSFIFTLLSIGGARHEELFYGAVILLVGQENLLSVCVTPPISAGATIRTYCPTHL